MLDDDRYRQYHGPEIEVKPWYQSPVVQFLFGLAIACLALLGVGYVLGVLEPESPESAPPESEPSESLSSAAGGVKTTPLVRVSVTKMGEKLEGVFGAFDGPTEYCALLVTNDSDETLALDAVFTYSTQSGREKGKSYDDATALAPGDFAILIGYDVYDAAAASYSLEASKPVDGMGSLHGMAEGREVSATADEAVIELTNTSKEDITVFCARCIMTTENGECFIGDSYTFGALAPGEAIKAVFTPQSMLDYRFDSPIVPDFDKMQRAYYVNGTF